VKYNVKRVVLVFGEAVAYAIIAVEAAIIEEFENWQDNI